MRLFGGRLDALNFLLADVRGGLGPYVGVFLLSQAHWDPARIGDVLTVSGLVGISLHAPIGALIDTTTRKRGLLILGVAMLSASALAIAWAPVLPVVLAADIAMAALGAVFAPTVAAITVGLVDRTALAERLGRNAAFDRFGNIVIIGIAGLVGWAFSQQAVFYLTPLFGLATTAVVLSIPAGAIDHARARGLDLVQAQRHGLPLGWRALVRNRPLLVLAAAFALFHFANAPLVPLLGQRLALAYPTMVTVLLSAAIMAAQLASIASALLVGTHADRWGRRPLLLLAFAILPLRAILLALSNGPAWLVAVQLLDGVSLGALDTLLALVLADLMRGTGRYNAARGLIGTIQGIGGSSSNAIAGWLVVDSGYGTAFLVLAAVACLAFLLVFAAMPETRPAERDTTLYTPPP